jgi:hypothetical protein
MWQGQPKSMRAPLASVSVATNQQVVNESSNGGKNSCFPPVFSSSQSSHLMTSRRRQMDMQNPKATTSNSNTLGVSAECGGNEELIKSWLNLPNSLYGVYYDLGFSKTLRSDSSTNDNNGISILQLACNLTPFEMKMQDLKKVLQADFSSKDTGLMYIREIFEPKDPDFPRPQQYRHDGTNNFSLTCAVVNVSSLAQEQVSRLRLLILGPERREVLMTTLKFFSMIPFNGQAAIYDFFDSFKVKYAKTRDHRKKLDELLAITIALRNHNEWMFRLERGIGRSKMVDSLAIRWKNLLGTRAPEELGLDEYFSFPAVLYLLQDFKQIVESAPTYGDPKMVFKYHPVAFAKDRRP